GTVEQFNVPNTNPTSPSWTDLTFTSGVTYTYRIKATDGLHDSDFSSSTSAITATRSAKDVNQARYFNARQDGYIGTTLNGVQAPDVRWTEYDRMFFDAVANW